MRGKRTKGHKADYHALAARIGYAGAVAYKLKQEQAPQPSVGRRIDPASPEGKAIAAKYGALPK